MQTIHLCANATGPVSSRERPELAATDPSTLNPSPPLAELPSPAAAPTLSGQDLACRRGHRLLFQGLALDVAPGQLVWLRGRNGRGKTSLLRILAGLTAPEHGRLLRDGVPARQSAAHARGLVFI